MSQPTNNNNKYLKYGDTILLYSNENPKTYLCARSILEKSVYYLQIPDFELLNIASYDNQAELIFSIYPKLYYEASKNYLKFKGTDLRKKSMLKKRMEAEKEINQKRIERFLSDYVTIGSEIQLFHVYSKCYVKATREKNSRSNQLFNLSLAKQLSSGMHFKIKINPYYSFKKDGERISYDDQFYFENLKLESRLVYKDVPIISNSIKLYSNSQKENSQILPMGGNSSPANKSNFAKLKRQGNIQDELRIEYPSVMEIQASFKQFEAGHRKDDINNFKALFLASPEVKEINNQGLKNIHWGDYVRIKHVRRVDKKQGVIYSEHVVTGQCPKAYFFTQENNQYNLYEKDSASSIFQLVTLNEELIGKPIEINSEKYSFPILLRHFLTGRYLKVGINDSNCCLSENLEKIIEKNPKISQLVSRKVGFKPRKTLISPIGKDVGTPIQHTPLLKLAKQQNSLIHLTEIKENPTNDDKNDIKENNNIHLDLLYQQDLIDFYRDAEIILTVASKDLGTLNSTHCFSLMGKNSERFLNVAEEEAVNEGRYTMMTEENAAFEAKNFLSSECFQRTFFNMNPLDRKNFSLTSFEEADFFFFTAVSPEEISDIMTITSKMFPFISLSSNFLLSNRSEILNIADSSLEKISFWVCESKEKRVDQIKTKPLPQRQKLLRELGVIDIIVKIIFELFDRRLLLSNSLKNNLDLYCLSSGIIALLHIANQNNYPNSIYIFQWYSLFKMIITDEGTSNELKIDDLLIQLFHETKLNVSYRGDLERLTPSIKFQNYNRGALNLVIAFCTFNEFLQKDDIEEIIQTVLESEESRVQIFKPFILKHQEMDQMKRIVIKIEKNNEIEINEKNFLSKSNIFQYVSKLLVLAIELSKGNPALVVPFFEELYPFEVCLELLKVKKINPGFKSLFVNLFIESYLAFDCRYSNIQSFPNNIKFKGHMFSHNQIDAKIKQNNLNLMIKYFNENANILVNAVENEKESKENGSLNLKTIIKDFLQNPEFLTKTQTSVILEDHHLIKSMINLCEFILTRGFYSTMSEAEDLRSTLQAFLKNSYSFLTILMDKKLNQSHSEKKIRDTLLLDISEDISKRNAKLHEDIMALSQWMTKILKCLIFLEKKNQDSFLTDFFSDSKNCKLFEIQSKVLSLKECRENKLKIKEFMYSLQYPDSLDIYYFIELLLLNNIEVSQHVVELLYLIFSMRKNFLNNINQTILIEDAFFGLYQALTNVYYKLHYSIIEVQYSKSNNNQRNNELLCDLDTGLKTLLSVVFVKNMKASNYLGNNNVVNYNNNSTNQLNIPNDNNKKNNDNEKEKENIINSPNDNLSKNFIAKANNDETLDEVNSFIYKINDDYAFDVRDCFRTQNLLREIGLHLEIFEIIKFVNKNTSFKDKTLELKNEILKKCIIFLIFFNIKNEENQTEVREYAKFEDMLCEILLRDNKNLQKLVFRLISEIYRDNYPVLLNLDKMNNELAGKLGKKFTINYETKKNKEYCVYFLLILTSFFKIKSKILTQNQTFLIKEFNKSIPDFVKTIEKCINFASEMQFSLDDNHKMIEIPMDILLPTIFFNVFSQIAEKSSNYVINYCKQFLSIRQIGDLLSKLDNWFMLKLEILGFLNQIYVKNKKLEDNESSELQFFIKECLLFQLNDYLANYQKLEKYTSHYFHSDLVNIFETKVFLIYSDELHLIHVDFLSNYEQYIIFGVIETFSNYLEKIPKKPNEIDLQILEFYHKKLEDLAIAWEIEFSKSSPKINQNNDKNRNYSVDKTQKIEKGTILFPNKSRILELSRMKEKEKTVTFSEDNSPKKYNQFLDEKNNFKDLQIEVEKNKNKDSKFEKGLTKFEIINDLSNVDLVINNTNVDIKLKKTPLVMKEELKEMIFDFNNSGRCEQKIKNLKKSFFLEEELEKSHIGNDHLIEDFVIEEEHSLELDYLVGFLIEIKTHESKDIGKFKKIVESLINVVGSGSSSIKTKLNAIKIIRKLSNFKKDMKVNEEIQKELVDIELMNFLCKVTAEEENHLIKYEYILGLVDFMDEVNENIQKSFFAYLEKDEENKFVIKMKEFIFENFTDFKDYEKSLTDQHSESGFSSVSSQFNKIIKQKISACTAGLELLRLGCENHYSDMQNFLRNQIQNGKLHTKSINMIAFVADLLEKYSKMITERNIELGEKLLDFLIETLQGPCNENQLVLCNTTKILENLEDIMLDLQVRKASDKISGFTNKMIILMLALFEGNKDSFVLNKIVTYVTPEIMYDRINQIYRNFYKLSKKHAYRELTKKNNNNNEIVVNYSNKPATNRSNSREIVREETVDDAHFKVQKDGFSEDKIENSISEGFNIYILMKLLSSVYPKLKEKISSWKKHKLNRETNSDKDLEFLRKSIKFYRINVVMIEIINNNKDIQRVFFRLPIYTKFLSSLSIKKFITTVNRESIDEKINGLLNNSEKFLEEMRHFMYLRAKGFRLGINSLSVVRDIGLIVSAVISLIILIKPEESEMETLKFFGVLQLVIEVLVCLLWIIFSLPLDYKSAKRSYAKSIERKKEAYMINETQVSKRLFNPLLFYLIIIKHMLFSSYLLYYTFNIAWATLGVTISPIFNSILLLDIIDRSVILQNVIKSITINWPQLVMTGILGVIVMFIYSMIGYYGSTYFRNNMIYTNQIGYDNSETLYLCDTPMHCFMFVVNIGLRSGGGVGDSVKQPIPAEDSGLYNDRFFFDLTFFLIMNVILLNIIFGIIIDTFAELRVQKNIRDFDEKNNCFICGTDRSTFEKVGISFNKHIKKEHNLLNYLFYVIHLRLKDPKDYNGTESYVAGKLKVNDISWFPIGRALSLVLKSENYLTNPEEENKKTKNHGNMRKNEI